MSRNPAHSVRPKTQSYSVRWRHTVPLASSLRSPNRFCGLPLYRVIVQAVTGYVSPTHTIPGPLTSFSFYTIAVCLLLLQIVVLFFCYMSVVSSPQVVLVTSPFPFGPHLPSRPFLHIRPRLMALFVGRSSTLGVSSSESSKDVISSRKRFLATIRSQTPSKY